MLKRVFKDCKFNSSNEIEEAITKGWDEFTFYEVQSGFHNWTSHFARAVENGGEHIIE
jgi:hypothetical protein